MPPGHPIHSNLPPHFTAAALPVRLHFGPHCATLRWLTPDDAGCLLEFFASHSAETVYQRYGHARAPMTPDQAARLVGVDQSRDAALGVFETHAHRPRLLAVGRYCLAPGGGCAEAAFVVHEQRRGLGIGTTLLAALIAIARERKLDRLVAEVRQGNAPMLAILRAAGATFEEIQGTTDVEATLRFSAPARRARRAGSGREPGRHAATEADWETAAAPGNRTATPAAAQAPTP